MVIRNRPGDFDARLGRRRTVFGRSRNHMETLDAQLPKGFMKIMHSAFKIKIQVAAELQEKTGLPMFTGRQIAYLLDLRLF